MSLLTVHDLIFILALLLSFATALVAAYLLISEVRSFTFLLLIGASSLSFSLHHLLELSLNVDTYNFDALLETAAIAFYVAAAYKLRQTVNNDIACDQ